LGRKECQRVSFRRCPEPELVPLRQTSWHSVISYIMPNHSAFAFCGPCLSLSCCSLPDALRHTKPNSALRRRLTVGTNCPLLILLIAILSQLAILPISALSQTPFYQGKTLKIINNDPGGTAGMRVKAVIPYMRKYIPGNPTIVVEFIEGGGGRRAANHVFRSVNPDGLTMRPLSSSSIGFNLMRETGGMYDIV